MRSIRVLRINADEQINSVNELILTELILDNTLGDFEPEEIVALLSAFVFEEKTDAEPQISPRLEEVVHLIAYN
jgi:antiviral helicase SKI2